jgi:hypothetical protein
LIIELVEADGTPAVVIVSWPVKPTVFHPHRFGLERMLTPACLPRRSELM